MRVAKFTDLMPAVKRQTVVEVWKDVPGYEGFYQVSNLGRVKSMARIRIAGRGGAQQLPERLKKPGKTKFGYIVVGLYRNSKCKQCWMHRLVLEAFIGPRPHKMETRHLDGDKTNNRLENLKWGTIEENWEDKRRHGTAPVGERNGQAVLTEDAVRKMRIMHKQGHSRSHIARIFKVGGNTAARALSGETWKGVK